VSISNASLPQQGSNGFIPPVLPSSRGAASSAAPVLHAALSALDAEDAPERAPYLLRPCRRHFDAKGLAPSIGEDTEAERASSSVTMGWPRPRSGLDCSPRGQAEHIGAGGAASAGADHVPQPPDASPTGSGADGCRRRGRFHPAIDKVAVHRESFLPEQLMARIDCVHISMFDLHADFGFCRDRIDRDCARSTV